MIKKIKIANAGGFWGDDPSAFQQQIYKGNIDYLTLDYLAEITMSILRKKQLKNPEEGYIPDIIHQIENHIEILLKKNIKLITNAGGLNPVACGKKIYEVLKKKGLNVKIAVIYGDNLLSSIKTSNEEFPNLDNPKIKFSEIQDRLEIANAYLGAFPIVEALKENTQIIITGRVTDAALVMAPMIFEFGWTENHIDELATALVAGHLIECGTQVTGGNFSDWKLIHNWNLGFPIVEAYEDSSFVIKKHKNTGGLISENIIKEQLLYEIQDPSNYISPDVIADFTTIQIHKMKENEIKLDSIRGKKPTEYYKLSMGYSDGYKISSEIIVSGPDALEKCKIFEDKIRKQIKNQIQFHTAYIGYNSCHKNLITSPNTNEILLRFTAFDYEIKRLEEFSRKIPALILSGPPGVSVTGGRQKITEVISYYPSIIKKEKVKPLIEIIHSSKKIEFFYKNSSYSKIEDKPNQISKNIKEFIIPEVSEKAKEVRFYELCLARSGDKGDHINLGIIARNQVIYEFFVEFLTANYIKFLFRKICKGKVKRYLVPNLNSMNFIMENSLEGGGTRSLQIDTQGKTIAQAFLNQKINIPLSLYRKFSTGEKL